uniref:Uncharacterized protein n=1 Tax=Siphoviridae sp. ctLmu1 TaxID=2826253 RepID=A0A8S5NG64_9CAUD|nr:MAG TPA: hypothetical protein [Siphoviridae sp. ctLmu1]
MYFQGLIYGHLCVQLTVRRVTRFHIEQKYTVSYTIS